MQIARCRKAIGYAVILVAAACWLNAQDSDLGSSDKERLAQGRAIYASLCQRCHGADGDSTDYPRIVPLAGIAKRIDQTEIPRLSAPFVGRNFEGDEALALIRYLSSLKGAKGFDEPGHLFSSYLLDKKKGYTDTYRVLDLRGETSYRASHLPGARLWPLSEDVNNRCLVSTEQVADALGQVDVSDDIFVIVYDEQVTPRATCVWWNIIRLGHERVAILDGGWDAWSAGGYAQSSSEMENATSGPAAEASEEAVILSAAEQETDQVEFHWKELITSSGLPPASAVTEYFDEIGLELPGEYQVSGHPEGHLEDELSVLIFLLHLLEYRTSFDSSSGALLIETESAAQ